ncbi:Elongator complex protein 2 [Galdieria sulphuraria]|uniref:Elongator complex protein 2 n=1 Tax=Galdieria sulphuraria TaxID=130081 RepID=M2XDA5_GALSU|nr:elongator complex protein 2 isoform 1 [Galdieria sulphuraria]EME27932.1 elongator complex protein 2 isoform 1 [Galdieria sulphuraria]GJD07847.1 Elongator complex protein 2 [Galdieria sulphuraria]|eukprot:XP_005704452.1 elongator complex protein 2 isoform 1 [Galdieria sulphuraria]
MNERIETKLCFIAGGCNRVSSIADWSNSGLSYGCQNTVIILDYEGERALCTLQGHSSIVRTTRWVNQDTLVTGDALGIICLWKKNPLWSLVHQEKVHKDAVVSIATFSCFHKNFIVSASSEASLAIFQVETISSSWTQMATTTLSFLPESISATIFHLSEQKSVLLIAVGGTDSAVVIFSAELCNDDNSVIDLSERIRLHGHHDWIRDVSFCQSSCKLGDTTFLASGSQDSTVRIWKVYSQASTNGISDNGESSLLADSFFKKYRIHIGCNIFTFTSEALLAEHEDRVCSVRWSTNCKDPRSTERALLSSSCDQSVLIWSYMGTEGVWMPFERLTSFGGAPSTTAGFFGAYFSPQGDSIWAHGFLGQMYCWKLTQDGEWKSVGTVSGHGKGVSELCWKPVDGLFLASVSLDQTTRIFAPVKGEKETFIEIARPQVHGHDIFTVGFVREDGLELISGAEEKVIRIFRAPRPFVAQCRQLFSSENSHFDNYSLEAEENAAVVVDMAALGLTNKAIFSQDESENRAQLESSTFHFLTENTLSQGTLWPEVAKLYGHGNPIVTCNCFPPKKMAASACQAQACKDACIIIWDMDKREKKQILYCHDLTVTRLVFSMHGLLLSVSRDRSFAIHREDSNGIWTRVVHRKNIHQRIIYDASWSHDERLFCTASRDKYIKFHWAIDENHCIGEYTNICYMFDTGVRCISFAPCGFNSSYLVAVGLENGRVCLLQLRMRDEHSIDRVDFKATIDIQGGCVVSVCFHPHSFISKQGNVAFLLAAGGIDATIRIYDIEIDKCK